jgi:hypothetical protein
MRGTEKRSSTQARQAVGEIPATRFTASTISSSDPTTNPVRPCATTSCAEPRLSTITGVPQAIASVMKSPKGSFQVIGARRQRALASSSRFRAASASPT